MGITYLQETFVWYSWHTDCSGKTKKSKLCYHSLPPTNTAKQVTGALSCPFKIGLSSQPIWVDLPDLSSYGWFTAHEIPSTRTAFYWLMTAKLALHLREKCPEVGKHPSGWFRALGMIDPSSCWPKYTTYHKCQEKALVERQILPSNINPHCFRS